MTKFVEGLVQFERGRKRVMAYTVRKKLIDMMNHDDQYIYI